MGQSPPRERRVASETGHDTAFHLSNQVFRWAGETRRDWEKALPLANDFHPKIPPFDWHLVHGIVDFEDGSRWAGSFAAKKSGFRSTADLMPHGFILVTSPIGIVEEHLYKLGHCVRSK